MQQSCATQDENGLNWKGEDGQREDASKFKARELVPKDVPRCLAEPPDIAPEHADEIGQKQIPPAGLRAFVTSVTCFSRKEKSDGSRL